MINNCATAVAGTASDAYVLAERPNAGNQRFVINGVPQGDNANASVNNLNYDFLLGSMSLNGVPSGFVAQSFGYTTVGSSMSAVEHAAEYAAFEYFRANIIATL